jgi:carboxyl-terminal processing protease
VASNRTALEKYNVENFVKGFKVETKLFSEFQAFARTNGYSDPFSSNLEYNSGLKLLIKASLAKQLFQSEGFYRVINNDAPIIREALKQFE